MTLVPKFVRARPAPIGHDLSSGSYGWTRAAFRAADRRDENEMVIVDRGSQPVLAIVPAAA
jgi:hypothetical protein